MTEPSSPVPTPDSPIATAIAAFCRRDHAPPAATVRAGFPSSPVWAAVVAAGTEPWLDTGDVDAIRALWTREFVAVTTNNTLLNKEIQKGLYDDVIPELAGLIREHGESAAERTVLEIAFALNAIHGLMLVRTFDADVSVELHTDLADDAEASYRYGKRFAAIEPDRFIVKIPLTPAGLCAARRLGDDGIRVNFTLGFSARQNLAVARIARPTWVNVFMGRLNSFVADSGLGSGDGIGEKATLASQRVLRELRASGAADVRQIGASIRSGEQVGALTGVDVLTIPTAAAAAFVGAAPQDIADRSSAAIEVEVDPHQAAKIAAFWDVDEPTRAAVDRLAALPAERLDAVTITAAFGDQGSDLFPVLDEADRGRLRAAGKIPEFAAWRERVDAGRASWDGLLSAAALAAFATDQAELDERIRRVLS